LTNPKGPLTHTVQCTELVPIVTIGASALQCSSCQRTLTPLVLAPALGFNPQTKNPSYICDTAKMCYENLKLIQYLLQLTVNVIHVILLQ